MGDVLQVLLVVFLLGYPVSRFRASALRTTTDASSGRSSSSDGPPSSWRWFAGRFGKVWDRYAQGDPSMRFLDEWVVLRLTVAGIEMKEDVRRNND